MWPPSRMIQKKMVITGSFGLTVGAGVGGYLSAINNNLAYVIVGSVVGFFVGNIVGILFGKTISLKSLSATENIANNILGFAGLILAIIGIIGFFLTGNWIGIVGFVFFTICGIILLLNQTGTNKKT